MLNAYIKTEIFSNALILEDVSAALVKVIINLFMINLKWDDELLIYMKFISFFTCVFISFCLTNACDVD